MGLWGRYALYCIVRFKGKIVQYITTPQISPLPVIISVMSEIIFKIFSVAVVSVVAYVLIWGLMVVFLDILNIEMLYYQIFKRNKHHVH